MSVNYRGEENPYFVEYGGKLGRRGGKETLLTHL